ncbi:MAG: class I SAM-dependent methyltransferase [Rhodobacteraceae bacterium]|jgi:SAM-dependent methyltransferase|nr:class I SAM-dependent methyltransferase [Paracoccaceae bacterium]
MARTAGAAVTDIPAEVAALDLSALGPGDLLNLVLQRSEVLAGLPRPGEIVRAWEAGDEGPIRGAVATLGEAIARRAAAAIHAEYLALRPRLVALAPARVADIGCGYGLFDLFLARDLGAELLLVDIEANARRHFGFQDEGAAYTSLATARALIAANGVPAARVVTLNPGVAPLAAAGSVDLAVSFLSCGFHYPVDAYMHFFARQVRPGGAVVLDLRTRTADRQIERLSTLGTVSVLPGPQKARRVLVLRGGGDG